MDKPVRKIDSFKKLPKVAEPVKPNVEATKFQYGLMKAGTVLTDIEKDGLKQLGIVDDPSGLPVDVAARISDIVAKSNSQQDIGIPGTSLKMPDVVDFKDLSPERKKEIADSIKTAIAYNDEEKKRKAALPPAEPPLDPKLFKTPEIIDDLLPVNKKIRPEISEDADNSKRSNSGVSEISKPATCAHCGWDTRKNDLIDITDDDKADFVQSILGGIRFKKVYTVFGGKLRITFRTLTTVESDMAYKQLIVDAQKDVQSKILGDTSFYWRTLMAYRCILAVEQIDSDQGVTDIPPISEIAVEDGSYSRPNTKLFAIFDDMVEQIMPSELVRTTITHLYTEFQSLCEKLQAMAESKDFWRATR